MKIAAEEEENKMSVQNLSVCFGPVFMWAAEETMAAIHEVKFQCLVVEHFIEHCDKFFSIGSDTKLLNETLRENSFSLTKRANSRLVDPDYPVFEPEVAPEADYFPLPEANHDNEVQL